MQELLLVGQKMSNVLFNLAQDERFAEYSEMMKGLQREWDAAQHSVHPTVLNVREIEVSCPACYWVFNLELPETHSG